MSLFGFDAMQDWESAASALLLWVCVILFGPIFLSIAATILLQHVTWPQNRRMR